MTALAGWWRIAVTSMLALGLGCTAPQAALAALGSAPFQVALEATPDAGANRITIRIDPRAGSPAAHGQHFDLYVVQLLGFQRAAFLGDSGTWSATPVSVRRRLAIGAFGPVTATWTEPRLGTVPVLVIGARPSSDPLVQANWVFRPVFRSVALRRHLFDAPDPWSGVLVLAGVGVASAVAIGLVLALAKKPPAPIESAPASPVF